MCPGPKQADPKTHSFPQELRAWPLGSHSPALPLMICVTLVSYLTSLGLYLYDRDNNSTFFRGVSLYTVLMHGRCHMNVSYYIF